MPRVAIGNPCRIAPHLLTAQKPHPPANAKPAAMRRGLTGTRHGLSCHEFFNPAWWPMFVSDAEIKVGVDTFDTKRGEVPLDHLNRKPAGQRLSQLMGRGDQPLVVALDGDWGSGKSHFLKLWTGSHKGFGGKAKVIYFDAFARDYLDDPFVSLVAAITEAQEKAADGTPAIKKTLGNLKKFAAKLVPSALRITAAVATAGATEGARVAYDAVADAAIEGLGQEAEKAIEQFWQREQGRIAAIEAFRSALAELAAAQPLILVIDELDRCRPDFALSLLEVVKHFFSVKGVRFVLGVRLEALEESVRHRYGPNTDARLYLQKFLHLRLSLPQDADNAAWRVHFHKVCKTFGVKSAIVNTCERTLGMWTGAAPTLRDVERIATRLALLPEDFRNFRQGIQVAALTAVVLEAKDLETYRLLRKNQLKWTDISQKFGLREDALDIPREQYGMSQVWRHLLLPICGADGVIFQRTNFGTLSAGPINIVELLSPIFDTLRPA